MRTVLSFFVSLLVASSLWATRASEDNSQYGVPPFAPYPNSQTPFYVNNQIQEAGFTASSVANTVFFTYTVLTNNAFTFTVSGGSFLRQGILICGNSGTPCTTTTEPWYTSVINSSPDPSTPAGCGLTDGGTPCTSVTFTVPAGVMGLVFFVSESTLSGSVPVPTVTTTPTTVTSVTSSTANGSYLTGQAISIQVNFSQPVTVTGTPKLALNSGGTASYTSGSGTSTLTFTYIIGTADTSNHLDYSSTSALTLNGGTITDGELNPAVLTLAAPGTAGSLGANTNFAINLTYTISGEVTFSTNGTPLSGVTVTLTGSVSNSFTTNSSGLYSFAVPANGTYTVTPSRSGYTFSPLSQTFNSLSANQTVNFTGTPTNTMYTISGQVTSSGAALSNVTVTLSGAQSGSTTTNSSGNYSFTNLASGGNYTITPSLNGYTFTPANQSFANLSANQIASFTATSNTSTYTISGQVMSNTGSPLSGIIVTLGGSQTGTTTTNASGNYTLSGVPAGGSYTVTPSSLDEAFLPITSTFSNLSANQTVNFIGSPIAGLYFYPVQPCRVADTRPPAGFSGQFGPPSLVGGTTRSFNIQASSCGIPSTAVAYSLNFTVVPPSGGPQANLTTWPTGLASGMPNVSTLNYSGSVVANAATVPAGTNGSINVYVNSGTDLIIDVNGYYALPLSSGLEFYTLNPCRIADTRAADGFTGSFGPPSLAGGAIRPFNIPASSCGVPATAAAYSLNFAVVPPPTGPAANLTTWPSSQASMPNVSTLNYSGSVVANAAIVQAGTFDMIDVYVDYPTDMLFDVNGYFGSQSSSGLRFYPVTPCRIADTRAAAGFAGQFGPPSMGAGTTRTFVIPAGVCGIPAGAAAYALNFTVVPPAGGPAANLTTWPTGLATPNVSTLNFYGSVIANAAIVPAGTNGAISVYVSFPTDVLFDINGYFAP